MGLMTSTVLKRGSQVHAQLACEHAQVWGMPTHSWLASCRHAPALSPPIRTSYPHVTSCTGSQVHAQLACEHTQAWGMPTHSWLASCRHAPALSPPTRTQPGS